MVPGKQSSGKLALRYLEGDETPEQFARSLIGQENNYEGFNIILGQIDDIWYYSNRHPDKLPIKLEKGKIYGLSNHLLDVPWPKVLLGKTLLSKIENPDRDSLFNIISDTTPVDDALVQVTGCPFETEKSQSTIFVPPFIHKDGRISGTRSQHVVLIKENNDVIFYDRFLQPETQEWITNTFNFNIKDLQSQIVQTEDNRAPV